MRPGQRSITAAMLVVCAAVNVAITGVPHRSHEPAIRLSGDAGSLVTEPTPTTEPAEATTTSAAPSTTAATTTTTRPAKATPSAARTAKRAAPSSTVVATTVANSTATTVRPTGLNPDGR